MLNILFALFLFGMLIVLCVKAIARVVTNQQPLNVKECALLVALSVGCLIALATGAHSVYNVNLLAF